ncbi:hypothetical protein LTR22_028501, partial [Elasticomyces elasticus]
MDEDDKVEAFLLEHIEALQQLSLKQISKEWIKVICPKKQANYPYRNTKVKSKTNKKPRVPGWWPDQKVCQWREPDHVKKEQRNRLVLHLLRLRPTAAQLELWNRDNFQATDMHKFADWTTFLEGVIPNLDNIPPVTKARNRRQLLKKIYTVARMEEEYKKFHMNGQYHYKEEVKSSVVVSKKRRRSAVPMSSARVSDGGALNPRSSDEGSVKRPCRQVEPRAAQASSTIGSGFDPTGHLSSPKTSR